MFHGNSTQNKKVDSGSLYTRPLSIKDLRAVKFYLIKDTCVKAKVKSQFILLCILLIKDGKLKRFKKSFK